MFKFFDTAGDTDYKYLLKEIGEEVVINDIGGEETPKPQRAIITNTNRVDTRFKDDRNITTLFEIRQGDFVKYDGLYWLIVTPVNKQRYEKYKGVLRVITDIIGMAIGGDIIGIPVMSYMAASSLSIDQILLTIKEKIILTTQNNHITRQLKVNDTFVKWGGEYRIENMDFTEPGLIHIHCSFQNKTQDTEYVCPTPWGKPGEEPGGDEPETTYNIQGPDNIKMGSTGTYTAYKYIEGVADPSAKFSFSIDYRGESASIADLVPVNDTTCKVENNDYPYYIDLVAEDADAGAITKKEIYLKSFL